MLKRILVCSFCFLVFNLSAGEGMWLPMLLKSLNESDMKALGMKMSAEDIYSINKGSLKDAIVHFNGGCTAEIISKEGLLLTNHHCGYGQIQSHSSVDNNLLQNGYWAKTRAEELVNKNLFVRFIEKMEDISEAILEGVNDEMSDSERSSIIDKNIQAYKTNVSLQKYQEISIKPFYNGNQFFAIYTITYNDVRLVGAPPESIGKFGADTDNWVWPRHTGDFSLFRIYAGPNNEPAEYSEENIPFTPKHHLPISLDGVEEGDFTLVFGFPGRTREYLPSPAVKQVVDVLNPAKINIRDQALKIMDKYMRSDKEVKIKYASKFASIANYWKKWIGERQGLMKTNAVEKKLKFEKEFVSALNKRSPYTGILSEFESLYSEVEPYKLTKDYYSEIAGRNIELLWIATLMDRLVGRYENNGTEGYNDYLARLRPYVEGLVKNYIPEIDKEVFGKLVKLYVDEVDPQYVPSNLSGVDDYDALAAELYTKTSFTNSESIEQLFNMEPSKAVEKIQSDPAYQFGMNWKETIDSKVNVKYNEINSQIDSLQRIYMKALLETFPDRKFYPDANSTMRVTYGQVNGYQPRDGVQYTPVTYLDGVLEKYVPGDYEFDVDPTLIKLYENKDYGDYADTNGKIPVCFIGSNHTSGGNSGSPAIDANGNLIGLNFDRVWEGTMSDINYDPSICRNIMVDARYILFIIDKYAGASHLVKEMDLVHPKKMR